MTRNIYVDVQDSSNIQSLMYMTASRTLLVTFRNGDVYRYAGVSVETIKTVIFSESVGKAFYSHIKGLDYAKIAAADDKERTDEKSE